MGRNPKVSVIIPVYNVGKYLVSCMDSILSQTLKDIEIICIDDGSTDNSLEIIEEFAKKDKRVIVKSQSNQGQGTARNAGLEIAQGEYISFVDSDDMIVPDYLEKLYEQSKKEKLEIISSEIEVRYEEDSLREFTKEEYYRKKGTYNYICTGKKLFADMIGNDDFCVSANILFIDREWLNSEGVTFPSEIFFEDAVFCLTCYIKARRMKQIPLRGYIYRVRKSSTMTSTIDYKRVYSWLEVFKEELTFLLNDKDDEEFQSALVEYIKLWSSYIQNVTSKAEGISGMNLPPIHDLIKFLLKLDKLEDVDSKNSEEKLLLLGIEKLVTDSKGVVIYGAGEVGQNVLNYLCKLGLRRFVKYYAVSEMNSNKKKINEIPILQIDNFKQNDSYLILLCSNDKNQLEMKRKLLGLEINNYFMLNARLRKLIREAVDN